MLLCVPSLRAEAQQEGQHPIALGVEATLLPEVTSRLRSRDLATVAWGGHLAASHRVVDAIPELRAALASLVEVPAEEGQFTALAVLDALVQTGASLAADELQAFVGGVTVTPALVLLVRDARGNRAALLKTYRTFDAERDWLAWLAMGHALASIADAEFAADLLAHQRAVLRVRVEEENHRGGGEPRGGGGRIRRGCGSLVVGADYPPTVIDELVADGRSGDVLLANGANPVFLRRSVHTEREVGIGFSESTTHGARERQRLAWLTQCLAADAERLPFAVERTCSVVWHGADELMTALREHRAQARADYRRLADMCVAARLVTAVTAAALEPVIEFQLIDLRKDKREPLPEVGKL
jgi:hypothetical protein